MTSPSCTNAVAVYCASSLGKQKAFHDAALSVGRALAEAKRPLVYGGGFKGIMGIVSGAVLASGGKVVGIVPRAMLAAGGEGKETELSYSFDSFNPNDHQERVETIIVDSMHERKVKMAERACAFLGLPGGFGTFDEIFEVATWTQVGIHNKPVILLNVLSFFDPLRELIQNGLREGYIQPQNENLIIFVDGPTERHAHETYDWGKAALHALHEWQPACEQSLYDWKKTSSDEVVNQN